MNFCIVPFSFFFLPLTLGRIQPRVFRLIAGDRRAVIEERDLLAVCNFAADAGRDFLQG